MSESAGERHGTAGFLLVLPGATVMGLAVGLATGVVLPATLAGLGAGLVTWGLIVSVGSARR